MYSSKDFVSPELVEIIRQELLKIMDIIGRHDLKNSSNTKRFSVGSMDFYIPRVRFAVKDVNKCMIMIYTGIETFLRMEFSKRSPHGTIIHRAENSYDLKDAIIKEIPSIVPIHLACEILKNLFFPKTALLGALEIEFSEQNMKKHVERVRNIIHQFGKFFKFRTKKLVVNWKIEFALVDLFWRSICDLKILEGIEMNGIEWHTDSLVPRKVFDTTVIHNNAKVPIFDSTIWMTENRRRTPEYLYKCAGDAENNGFATARFPEVDDVKLWDHQHFPVEQLNEKVQLKRNELPDVGLVVRWNKSECGMWVHMMEVDQEKRHLDYFKKETCGLRWMCKKCADPFDYWYYQTLPCRIYQEPEWIDIGFCPGIDNADQIPIYEKTLKNVREKFGQTVQVPWNKALTENSNKLDDSVTTSDSDSEEYEEDYDEYEERSMLRRLPHALLELCFYAFLIYLIFLLTGKDISGPVLIYVIASSYAIISS